MGNYFTSCLRLALGARVHRSNEIQIEMHGTAMGPTSTEAGIVAVDEIGNLIISRWQMVCK